jgi:ligand-binding sensor domain-containing protein
LQNGISSYDPATGIFTNYSVKNIDSTSPVHDITMLFIDKENNVWAGLLQKGLIKLDKANGTFLHYDIIPASNTFYSAELRSSYNIVYDMYEEGNSIYWLATHDGLYRFNEKTKAMQPVRAKPIIKDMVRDDLFLSVANDRNGLWLGSWAGGISYYNFKTSAWSNYKFTTQLTNTGTINIAYKINFDKNGALWLATSDKGIGSFDTTTKHFDFCSDDIHTRSMMPANHCSFFYRDRTKQSLACIS